MAFDVPILLIIFNRPDTTEQVFEAIRKAEPQKLYIACDGPRPGKPTDIENSRAAKEVVSKIDWPCEVKHLYREENLGCGKGPAQAIDWFFAQEEEGIILEDDCIPSPSFFRFCAEMLEKYRHHENIMHINGTNFQDGQQRGEASYYFSAHQHCWGWATWRRAWQRFDYQIADYPIFKKRNGLKYVSPKRQIIEYWTTMLEQVYDNPATDIWDYQWSYAIWNTRSLCITPNKNLISNIGFGPNATHTTWVDFLFNRERFELDFPLVHPGKTKRNKAADLYFNIFYKAYSPLSMDEKIERAKAFLHPKKNPWAIRAYQWLKPFLVKYMGWKKEKASQA